MAMQSRLARPFLHISKRNATLPLAPSAYARPEIVDMSSYQYPNNPENYPGKGPFQLPEKFVRDEKVVWYIIPKTFADWLSTKMGDMGVYTFTLAAFYALSSKEIISYNPETGITSRLLVACALVNMMLGDTIRNGLYAKVTADYDRLYAVKEHDLEAYEEIVGLYREAQVQAQGQALYNQQKLTNLALMLETEYLERQNKLVSEVSRKLNYQMAVQAALSDHESRHMISWIEGEVQKELDQLDQDAQIQDCVNHLKTL